MLWAGVTISAVSAGGMYLISDPLETFFLAGSSTAGAFIGVFVPTSVILLDDVGADAKWLVARFPENDDAMRVFMTIEEKVMETEIEQTVRDITGSAGRA